MSVVDEYKYLGIILDNKLNLIHHAKEIKKKKIKEQI